MIPPVVSKVNLFVPGNLAAVVAKVVRELLPVFGTAPQIRQTHPLSRHRFVHTLSFSRSASSVMRKEYSSISGAVCQLGTPLEWA